jgi:hypothetical protein
MVGKVYLLGKNPWLIRRWQNGARPKQMKCPRVKLMVKTPLKKVLWTPVVVQVIALFKN